MAINGSMFDRFSLLHALSGHAMRRAGLSEGTAVALAVAWELVENQLKDRHPEAFPHPSHDSPANAFGDVVSAWVGYKLTARASSARASSSSARTRAISRRARR